MSILRDAAVRAERYLESLSARPVAPEPAAVERLQAFAGPLPSRGAAPEEVVRELDEVGSPGTMAMAGPRFFGFVIGGALPAALAAQYLAGAWDQNAALWNTSPTVAMLEEVALGWLVDLLGLPAGTVPVVASVK